MAAPTVQEVKAFLAQNPNAWDIDAARKALGLSISDAAALLHSADPSIDATRAASVMQNTESQIAAGKTPAPSISTVPAASVVAGNTAPAATTVPAANVVAGGSPSATNTSDYLRYVENNLIMAPKTGADGSDSAGVKGGGPANAGINPAALTPTTDGATALAKWNAKDPSIDPYWAHQFMTMNEKYTGGEFAPGSPKATLDTAKAYYIQQAKDNAPSGFEKVMDVVVPLAIETAFTMGIGNAVAPAISSALEAQGLAGNTLTAATKALSATLGSTVVQEVATNGNANLAGIAKGAAAAGIADYFTPDIATKLGVDASSPAALKALNTAAQASAAAVLNHTDPAKAVEGVLQQSIFNQALSTGGDIAKSAWDSLVGNITSGANEIIASTTDALGLSTPYTDNQLNAMVTAGTAAKDPVTGVITPIAPNRAGQDAIIATTGTEPLAAPGSFSDNTGNTGQMVDGKFVPYQTPADAEAATTANLTAGQGTANSDRGLPAINITSAAVDQINAANLSDAQKKAALDLLSANPWLAQNVLDNNVPADIIKQITDIGGTTPAPTVVTPGTDTSTTSIPQIIISTSTLSNTEPVITNTNTETATRTTSLPGGSVLPHTTNTQSLTGTAPGGTPAGYPSTPAPNAATLVGLTPVTDFGKNLTATDVLPQLNTAENPFGPTAAGVLSSLATQANAVPASNILNKNWSV